MKSFRDYTPGTGEENGRTEEPSSAAGSTAAELTKKIAAAYNGKSSAEMLKSILAEAERSKRAGTLSDEEIDTFYEQFSPLLGPVQRRQLRSVVEKLKKI